MALQAYRHLLRATRIAFQGDLQVLSAARTQAREGFDQLRSLNGDSEEALKGIEHAEGVAEVLMKNVVQGKAKDGDLSTLKLRIHEHTERGDNDTIKGPGGRPIKIGGV